MKDDVTRPGTWHSFWLPTGGTLLVCLILQGLAVSVLWTSHLEEVDRQLLTLHPARLALDVRAGSAPLLPAAFVSGEPAEVRLLQLSDASGGLIQAPAWPANGYAGLAVGGGFKTRVVDQRVWRVMGLLEEGFTLRAAMSLDELVDETLSLLSKTLLASLLLSAASGWLINRRGQLREEQSLQAARQFGADAGHELRTPLAVIRGTVESALHEPPAPAQMPAFLESLLVQCRKLRTTLDALQFLARCDAGTLRLENKEVDVSALVAELAADLANETEDRDLRVATQVAPAIKTTGDAGLLRVAIWNLMINAVRHNFEQRGSIDITLSADAPAKNIQVQVHNTAPPLAADEHELIFERFQRGRTARQAGVPGQGLGLSLARAAAEAHGGTLLLAGSTEAGTTFQLALPVR